MGDFHPEAQSNGLDGCNLIALICNKNSATFNEELSRLFMLQMYKVFINDTPIFIHNVPADNAHSFSEIVHLPPGETTPKRLWEITSKNLGVPIGIRAENDINAFWLKWKQQFIEIEAAGGLVLRPDDSFLGIYRLGKWDLPKGKADSGETPEVTALREVEEECGVTGLSIVRPICKTYHVYPFRKQFALKTTHWYLMNWDGSGTIAPQTEEGIEEIRWIAAAEREQFCNNTYQSVAEVVQQCFPTVEKPMS